VAIGEGGEVMGMMSGLITQENCPACNVHVGEVHVTDCAVASMEIEGAGWFGLVDCSPLFVDAKFVFREDGALKCRVEHECPGLQLHGRFWDEGVREQAVALAVWIGTQVPESNAKSLALSAVQEACFWASAAISLTR
jgi:hypothetical protein